MQTSKHLSDSWAIVSSDYLTWILAGLLVYAAGNVIPIILSAPLTVGFAYMFLKASAGEKAELGEVGKGFSKIFDAIFAYIVSIIIVAVGFILLVIPGIIFLVWYIYTPIVIADKNLGFWEAMKESKRIAKKDFWGTLFLGVVLTIINLLGFALFVVWIVTIPLTFGAYVLAYKELVAK